MRYMKDSHGFTIIEMIAILLIIGVLSAVAISKVSATDTYSLTSEVETLKAHLRFAQARAMSHEDSWGISLATDSYTLLKNGTTAPYKLPNENSATHTFQNGVSKTSGATIVVFDKWGRPVDTLGNPVTDPIPITLSGSHTITFTVTKNTGFIQ